MNYTYCSHGNYWHACSDQECANLGHVTTAICEYCKLKDVRTEATMNKRGYQLCQQCYDSQAKAERESDEFNEQFYKNQAILMKETAKSSCKKTIDALRKVDDAMVDRFLAGYIQYESNHSTDFFHSAAVRSGLTAALAVQP